MRQQLSRQRRRCRERQARKPASTIPHLGVRVSSTIVRRHRYLRDHGLPYSERAAAVTIASDCVTA
jgi:hypothetical protein